VTEQRPDQLPTAPPVTVLPERIRWPWDAKTPVFAAITALSLVNLGTLLLATLGILVRALPSDPSASCSSTRGPDPAQTSHFGILAGIVSILVVILGWTPEIPSKVRLIALAIGIGPAVPLCVALFG
jgi:hypothetical protein